MSIIVHGSDEPNRSLAFAMKRWADDGLEILSARDLLSAQSIRSSDFSHLHAATLNRLARSASGEHLVFCHASVAPRIESLTAMLSTLAATQAEAIVCGYQTDRQDGQSEIIPVFAGPPELSTSRDVYGEKFFLVRKARFLEAGGFATEPEIAEIFQWEFLNRLKASGCRIFSVPVALASVQVSVPPPVLSEYQLGRLTAPWAAAAPKPLQGFVRMALHPERKTGAAPDRSAVSEKPGADKRPLVLDTRCMELATLLAQRIQATDHSTNSILHRVPQPVGDRQPGERNAQTTGSGSTVRSVNSVSAIWSTDSLLNDIERGPGEENEFGRHSIGSDGGLLHRSGTYVVQSAEDAEGCDFLVADDLASADECRAATAGFREIHREVVARGGRSATAGGYLRFEEVLAACPDAAAPMIDAVRRATGITARFYDLTVPIYPTRLNIARAGEGTFEMPRRAIAVPSVVANGAPRHDLVGYLCLDDDGEGGEVYFTALDIAVRPRRGRYIGCTASAYHERAILKVTSGAFLLMTFVMRFSPDDMSPSLRRLY